MQDRSVEKCPMKNGSDVVSIQRRTEQGWLWGWWWHHSLWLKPNGRKALGGLFWFCKTCSWNKYLDENTQKLDGGKEELCLALHMGATHMHGSNYSVLKSLLSQPRSCRASPRVHLCKMEFRIYWHRLSISLGLEFLIQNFLNLHLHCFGSKPLV